MIWRSSFNSKIAQAADYFTLVVAFLSSYEFWEVLYAQFPDYIPYPIHLSRDFVVPACLIGVVYIILFNLSKAYSYQRFTSLISEFVIVLKVSSLGFFISITFIFLTGSKSVPRTIVVLFAIVSLFSLMVEKGMMFAAASYIRRRGKNRRRIVLVGTGTRAQTFIETVNRNFEWGLDIVGLLTGDKERVGKEFYGIRVLDTYENIEAILKNVNPEEVIVTISTRRFDQIRNVLEVCEREGVKVRLNSDFFGKMTKNVTVDNVYGLNIISFDMVQKSEMALALKRLIDLVGASVTLVVFSPFMLIAALGILLTDGRPVFYDWNVVGRNKKPFRSWKFRTMMRGADERKDELLEKNEMQGPVFKIKDDPRILPFGRWLRKWSIDETPQLFSVLKGDMSLVGPRPAGPHELDEYESWQRRRLSVQPGLTCLWQVNGRNDICKFDDWVRMDLEYIDHWSLWLDLKILLKTVPAVLAGKGAS